MSDWIRVERLRAGLATVTLNRPERRNALSIAMMEALIGELENLAAQREVRVVILRGEGPVFCAGLDLAEATQNELVRHSAHCVAKTLHTLRYGPLVSIAAVHGGAYAGGAGVVAACDMAVGAADVKIGFPEARRGLLPALISDVLKTKIREGDLTELFLVGEPIDAERSRQIGLLQRVVAAEKLLDEAVRMADGILAGGPQTIIDTKSLIHHAYRWGHDPAEGQVVEESHSIDEHLKARFSAEATEGLRAFLEKRAPSWLQT